MEVVIDFGGITKDVRNYPAKQVMPSKKLSNAASKRSRRSGKRVEVTRRLELYVGVKHNSLQTK